MSITYQDIEQAAARINGVAHRTPVMTSREANRRSGGELFFKCENFQRVGAFKFRGAYNAIAKLPAELRARGIMAYSSGNHAQGAALAAQRLGVPAVILMPQDAPAIKVAATKGYGAEVIFYDRYRESREAIGARIARERSLSLIPSFDHEDIIAGQGTAAKELFDEVGALDMLLVCVGGGGLISGSAIAAQVLAPRCQVIGVEPEAGNDAQQSLAKGCIVSINVPNTIADGAQTTSIGQLTFPIMQKLVKNIVTVTDTQLINTMSFFAERMKMVVEPTGCLAAAAALANVVDVKSKRVGVIVSGGNIDLNVFAQLVAS